MTTDSKYLLFLLVFFSSFVTAQVPKVDSIIKPKIIKQTKWEGGFLLGATAYTGDLEFAVAETRPAVGLFVRRAFGNYFALNSSLYQGILAGSDKHSTETDWRVARNIRFTSSLTELTLRGELHFFGFTKKVSQLSTGTSVMDDANNQTQTFRQRARRISPYIYVGGGLALVNPKTNFNDSPSPNPITELPRITADKAVDFTKMHFITPFGGGLRMPMVNKQAIITLEGGFRPTYSDYLDGMSIAGNPNKNDWYFVGALGVSKMLGATKDSDKDGIADKYDLCPFLKGDDKHQGCPDRDGDGVTDDKDECPNTVGLAIYEGCPDTDEDGIIDKFDDCPTEAGSGRFKGCSTEEKQLAAKKNKAEQNLTTNLDTIKTKVDTTLVPSQPIEITQIATKNDTLLQTDKPISAQAPPQYVSEKPLEKPTETTKPASETVVDTLISKTEKPITIVTPSLDTPQYITQKPIIKPKEVVKPTISDTLISKTEKPITVVTPLLDTPQYITQKPLIKPTEVVKPTIVDTLISKTEKPITVITPSLDTPQLITQKPLEKPAAIETPGKQDTLTSIVEKPIQAVSSPIDTQQYVSGRPIDKPIDSTNQVVKDTLVAIIEKPIRIDTLREVKPYLENATVADTLNNAFAIIRNHYTISPVYFETSKSIYRAESFVILDEVAYILLANPKYKLRIKGHTDAVGKIASNQTLSVSRAKMCYLYLQRKGVPTKQMSFKGFGQLQPAADNDTDVSRQLNRRVEFEIITD